MGAHFREAHEGCQHPGARRRKTRLCQRILHLLGQPREREIVRASLEQSIGQAGHQLLHKGKFSLNQLGLQHASKGGERNGLPAAACL